MIKKVYLAGPFFNRAQRAQQEKLEEICRAIGLDFYSPRKHSGSADLTEAQRKDPAAWKRVFESNVQALMDCQLLVASVNWALPPEELVAGLRLMGKEEPWTQPDPSVFSRQGSAMPGGGHGLYRATPLDIPDAGTVWEMGFAYSCNTFMNPRMPIVAFAPERPIEKFNLMLQFGCDIAVGDWDQLLGILRSFHAAPQGASMQVLDGKGLRLVGEVI